MGNKILIMVDAPHWACMNVAKGIQKYSKHQIEIGFWWYHTPHHDFEPEDFDINYIHTGALLSRERWNWVRSNWNKSKWVVGYRGWTAKKRVLSKIEDMYKSRIGGWDAVSFSNRELMGELRHMPDVPKYYCPSGVDLERFEEQPFPDDFKIMWAGAPHNGAKCFIDLLKLTEYYPYTFAGSKRDTDWWAPYVECYKHHDMPDFYSSGSVYVSTSDREGSPLPPREAMASGRPVVARRAGDISYFVPDEFLGDSWKELCPIIDKLWEEPEYMKWVGHEMRLIAEEKLGFRTVVPQYYDVMFDEVLER